MAERRRPARSRDRDPDGVIANRVIQDIIQNASAEFRDYLQRSGTVPQGGAVPMAGGGGMGPGVQGPPGPPGSWVNPYDPNPPQSPVAGLPEQGPRMFWPIDPMRPDSSRWPGAARRDYYYGPVDGAGNPVNGMPMPSVSVPDIGVPMPTERRGAPVTWEDGSVSQPPPSVPPPPPLWMTPPMPRQLSAPDLLRMLGLA